MEMIRQEYTVTMFTATRKFEGIFHPMGALFEDINDPEKGDFYLTEVTFSPLSPGSRFGLISMPEVVVRKHNVIFFYFRDKSAHEKLRLLTRTERIAVYTETFALQGDFHLGAEQKYRDMFDTMRGDFQPMTDVTLFPLLQTQVPLVREHDMILINTQNMYFYHPSPGGN